MAGHPVLAQAATSNPKGSGSISPIIVPALPATPLPRLAVEPDPPRVSQAINQKLQGPNEPEHSSDIDQGSAPSQGAQQARPSTEQAAQPETARPADLPPGVIDWTAQNLTPEIGFDGSAPSPTIHEPGEGQAHSGITGGGPAATTPVPTPVQGILSAEANPTPETGPIPESRSATQTTEPLKAREPLPPQKTNQNTPQPALQTTPTTSQSAPQSKPQPTKVWDVITNLFFSIFGFNP